MFKNKLSSCSRKGFLHFQQQDFFMFKIKILLLSRSNYFNKQDQGFLKARREKRTRFPLLKEQKQGSLKNKKKFLNKQDQSSFRNKNKVPSAIRTKLP